MVKKIGRTAASAVILAAGLTLPAVAQQSAPRLAAQREPAALGLDAAPADGASADPLAPSDTKEGPATAPGAADFHAPVASEAEDSPVAAQILVKLAQGDQLNRSTPREDIQGLTSFYGEAKGQPLWMTKDGLTKRASAVVSELKHAAAWGLDPASFAVPDYPSGEQGPDALADAEIKVSLAVLKYARYARGGRFDLAPWSVIFDQKPRLYDPKSVLEGIAAAGDPGVYLQSLHPKHEQFQRLKKALAALETEKAAPVPVKIPPGQPIVKGDRSAQVIALRERLAIPGDAGNEDVYDAPLEAAVRKYQQDRDMKPTGVVDKRVRAALNEAGSEGVPEKKQRILVNMERWRWVPETLGDFYVWNNIPEQLTRVVNGGKVEHVARIVVGKPNTPTPVFSARMQFVIFHPEWGVPDSIKEKELLPRLRRNSGGGDYSFWGGGGGGGGGAGRVLRGQGMRISINGREVDPDSVNWWNVDVRRVDFIQASGGRNVLGVVKFRFPNKHDVYMHDTPERQLFNEKVRAFSHGCMRTQNPVRLAEILLAHDKGMTPEQVQKLAARNESGPNEIVLTTQIPVHVTYFTASVDDDGKLESYRDLYGYDSKIAAALKGDALRFNLPQQDYETSADAGTSRRFQERVYQRRPWNPFEELFNN